MRTGLPPARADERMTAQRVERALIVAAELVDLYGEVYAPIFERLEAEFIELRRRETAIERARQVVRRAAARQIENSAGSV